MSVEEKTTVATEDRAGPNPVQAVVAGKDFLVPTGGAGEVGDSAVPSNMHPTLPQLPA